MIQHHDDPRHGTYAGYQAHLSQGFAACGACLKAANSYMREYRAKGGEPVERQQRRRQARQRALTRLAAIYPDVLEALIDEELK